MSLEDRIEAKGRGILSSPLWSGLLITMVLFLPLVLVPSVPLWVDLFWLVVLLPSVLGGTYFLHYLYGWLTGSDTNDSTSTNESRPTAIEQLRQQYATGNISEETFERRLERLLETEETETRQHRSENAGTNRERDLLTE